jgi:hypothetical protein
MKRSHLLLAVIGLLVAGMAMSACTSKKMMQIDAPMKHAERTT